MRKKVFDFDCTNIEPNENNYGIERPDFLSVKKHGFNNIKKLINKRPREMVEIIR